MIRSAAKRSQDAYNDLNQKLERRIAEISEMQRLAEDRVRQEWVAFKADEQKRWTSHSLSLEEAMRDMRKDLDKLEGRVTQLNDFLKFFRINCTRLPAPPSNNYRN